MIFYQEYHLIIQYDSENLDGIVENYLNDGWKLYGNPIITKTMFAQAVIKETPENND